MNLSTQPIYVATDIDNIRHPPLLKSRCANHLLTILNLSKQNAHNKTIFNSFAQTFWFEKTFFEL